MNVGNYRGMGARYVNALFRGCVRNLTKPFRFVCFTDDPSGLDGEIQPRSLPSGIHGWYNKLALFRAGAFPRGERVLFFDLDVVILSNIDTLLEFDGTFAILRNPKVAWHVNSSVMSWEAGECDDIWEAWQKSGAKNWPGGDQGWIYEQRPDALRLQSVFPGRFRSFTMECAACGTEARVWRYRWRLLRSKYAQVPYPHGADVVFFHGEPKPDNVRSRWVREAWRQPPKSGYSSQP